MLILWPVYQLGLELNQYPGIMSISGLLKKQGYVSEAVPADFEIISGKRESRSAPQCGSRHE